MDVMARPDRLELKDVANFFEYEKVRDAMRQRVMALKRARRVGVGRYLSFVFENRDTVLFQVQEMCRVERITDDDKIQDELDVYNTLLPRPGELSATMMIEIAEQSQIKPILDRFLGIDTGHHLWLHVGREFAIPGDFETGHSDEDKGKLSAVHFVRFAFSPEAISAFRTAELSLAVDHPADRARTKLSEETRAALLSDLILES
jgi:Protein of unknown function (DUF3501)